MTFRASLSEIVAADEQGVLAAHTTWCRVPLAEIANIVNGFAFPSGNFTKDSGTPLLRIRDILRNDTETYYRGEYDPAYLVEPGNLVVGMDGDFNCALWQGPRALLNQRVCKLVPDERFYSKKLLSFILPGYLNAINANTPSVTVKHLSSITVAEIPLPLPPLREQEKIVGEIEKQFTRLEAGVVALKRVQVNLKRYRAAVLKAAVEGRLVPTEAELARREGRSYEPASELLERILAERKFAVTQPLLAVPKKAQAGVPVPPKTKSREPAAPDTTDLPKLPDGWAWCSLRMLIIEGPQNGLYLPRSAYGGGVPILRIDDFQDGWSRNSDELRQVHASSAEEKCYALKVGDLVINRVNSPSHLGKALLVEQKNLPALFESNMMRLLLVAGLNSRFIEMYLRSKDGRARLIQRAKWAVNQASINQTDVGLTLAPIPPIAEQHRIVAEVERRLSVIDELEMQVEANLKRAERLRQAILKRAFEGKLVPQDPNDEPASMLLERIRAERQTKSLINKPDRRAKRADES